MVPLRAGGSPLPLLKARKLPRYFFLCRRAASAASHSRYKCQFISIMLLMSSDIATFFYSLSLANPQKTTTSPSPTVRTCLYGMCHTHAFSLTSSYPILESYAGEYIKRRVRTPDTTTDISKMTAVYFYLLGPSKQVRRELKQATPSEPTMSASSVELTWDDSSSLADSRKTSMSKMSRVKARVKTHLKELLP